MMLYGMTPRSNFRGGGEDTEKHENFEVPPVPPHRQSATFSNLIFKTNFIDHVHHRRRTIPTQSHDVKVSFAFRPMIFIRKESKQISKTSRGSNIHIYWLSSYSRTTLVGVFSQILNL